MFLLVGRCLSHRGFDVCLFLFMREQDGYGLVLLLLSLEDLMVVMHIYLFAIPVSVLSYFPYY